MIKAGSLFYALVISLLIAITTSFFLLSFYYKKIETINYELEQRLQRNVISGYNLLLSKQNEVGLNQQKQIDLFGDFEDSVSLQLKSWGAYEIAISQAKKGNKTVTRIGQIGYLRNKKDRYSLYLADKDKPLSLCGNTIITGNNFLPKTGVKRAYIEGQSFVGAVLIDGEIKYSEPTLPPLNNLLLTQLQQNLLKKSFDGNDSIIVLQNGLSGDTLNNSFFNKTLIFLSNSQINLSTGIYSGNLIIRSGSSINISGNVILNDIIIVAPKIKINKGFHGNIQAFATDSIILAPEVTLHYPSVLAVFTDGHNLNASHIILSQNDTITGDVFICSKSGVTNRKSAGLIIPKTATIVGQAYSNGYADIQGTIIGSMMCEQLLLKTPSSVYENHLLNATIDIERLPEAFTSSVALVASQRKKTIKWLY